MKCLIFLAGLLCLPAFAVTSHFTKQEINFMHDVYQQADPHIRKEVVKQRLMEDQFLLAQAQRLQPHLLTRLSDVGFSTEHHIRRFLTPLLNKLADEKTSLPLKLKDKNLLTQRQLMEYLGQYPANGKLDGHVLEKLQQIPLLAVPDFQLTLAEVYLSLSMQGRFKLHQGDIAFLANELQKRYDFILLLERVKPLMKSQNMHYAHFYDIALASILRPDMQNYFGIAELMHSHSDTLERLNKQISEKDIIEFYHVNRGKFKFLSEVDSRAVLFKSKSQADVFAKNVDRNSWFTQVEAGNFTDEFKQYNNQLNRKIKNWQVQTAFSLAEHTISRPLRTPENNWLVVNNGAKKYDYFEPLSETVKYQAKKFIALKRARFAYNSELSNWLKTLQ